MGIHQRLADAEARVEELEAACEGTTEELHASSKARIAELEAEATETEKWVGQLESENKQLREQLEQGAQQLPGLSVPAKPAVTPQGQLSGQLGPTQEGDSNQAPATDVGNR